MSTNYRRGLSDIVFLQFLAKLVIILLPTNYFGFLVYTTTRLLLKMRKTLNP